MRGNSRKLQLAELIVSNGRSVLMVFADSIPEEWERLRRQYPNLVWLDNSKTIAGHSGIVLDD